MRGRLAVLLIVAAAVAAVPQAAAFAAQSPAWRVAVSPYPTIFQPGTTGKAQGGPGFYVTATNVGALKTQGEYTITDVLPAGIVPAPTVPPTAATGYEKSRKEMACTVSGRTVTCSSSAPLYSGEQAQATIPVKVPAGFPEGEVMDLGTIEGGGAPSVTVENGTDVSTEATRFELAHAFVGASGEDGATTTQAGSHPFQLSVNLEVATMESEGLRAPGDLRAVSGNLPAGVLVNPQATVSKCTEAQLESIEKLCPPSSQIGVVRTIQSLAGVPAFFFSPLYNMVAPYGVPAELGFEAIEGVNVHLIGRVRSDGDYGLSADVSNIPAQVGVLGAEVTLWGNPSAETHDALRGKCISVGGLCPTDRLNTGFLTMPTKCSVSPILTVLRIESWTGVLAVGSSASATSGGNPLGIDGCGSMAFSPTIESQPTTDVADSPAGLSFSLHQPQELAYEGLSTAALKNVTVVFPEGMTLNPAAAGGRLGCSISQMGLLTPQGSTPINFSSAGEECPNAAKLGTVEVKTPLLDHPLMGSVYLATPFDNPFGSLLGIYLAVEDEQTGIVAKLAGKVIPDPTTGRLTTVFVESPQLPLEDVRLNLFNGPRAPLTTPFTCGTKTTISDLTPWSTPERADAHPADSFPISMAAPGYGSCPESEAQAPKSPSFAAGTISPVSGAYSPFVLRIARSDGTQHLTGIETTLPEGLLGRLAGITYCSESGIAQARSREQPEMGKLQQQNPSCSSASEVGVVEVTAGSGINPFPVSGHAYLAGPYKGAPLSLVVIAPAVAGPFDLGTVVDRVALIVNPYDARIHAVADPLPTIKDGIPLDVRSIELKLERSNFTLNPTSCEAMSIEGSVSTQAGQTAPLSNRFQVGECGNLAFKPKLSISLKGGTKRAAHPALKAVVTYPKQGAYANIARAQVSLPHSEFLDQNNIGKTCTKPLLEAGACPASSSYGKVKAWTPLLDKPLEGNIYLVGGFGYKLPAMVAELNGQIRVLLVGKVDTDKQKGIRNTFEAVPDAPVEKFVLELKGGKKFGLLINSENICKKKQIAGASFKAQNGKALSISTKIGNSCKGGSAGKKKHKAGKKKHKKGSTKKNR